MNKTPDPPVPLHLHMAIVHANMVKLAQLVDDIDMSVESVNTRTIEDAVARWAKALAEFQAFLLDMREPDVPTPEKLAELLKVRLAVVREAADSEPGATDDEDTF